MTVHYRGAWFDEQQSWQQSKALSLQQRDFSLASSFYQQHIIGKIVSSMLSTNTSHFHLGHNLLELFCSQLPETLIKEQGLGYSSGTHMSQDLAARQKNHMKDELWSVADWLTEVEQVFTCLTTKHSHCSAMQLKVEDPNNRESQSQKHETTKTTLLCVEEHIHGKQQH